MVHIFLHSASFPNKIGESTSSLDVGLWTIWDSMYSQQKCLIKMEEKDRLRVNVWYGCLYAAKRYKYFLGLTLFLPAMPCNLSLPKIPKIMFKMKMKNGPSRNFHLTYHLCCKQYILLPTSWIEWHWHCYLSIIS